jgi:Flp pilus assembly pilin Flp
MSPLANRADLPVMTPSASREEAQTLAEYAVILGVITPIVVLAFIMFGQAIPPILDRVRGFL